MSKWKTTILAAALALLWLCPAVLAADSQVEHTVDARPDGLVTISNVAGSVEVTGWDRNEVEVTGTLGRGVEKLNVESRGSEVEVEVELARRVRGWDGNARLEIRVPKGSDVEIEVVSAEVTISGVQGKIQVESVSGSIDVKDRPAGLDLESVSGSIDVEADVKSLSAETVSGRIRLRGAIREVDVGTVSGEIELRTDEVKHAELSSTSGGIEIYGALAAGAQIDAESHSGTIELGLPPSTSARFKVTTYSGRIDNQLGPAAERTGRYTPGKELEFSIGGGDARVRIESFSGSVYLRRQ